MSELVDSPSSFYLNCEQFNSTTEEVEAKIKIEDRDDILKRQDRWCVHVTRFSLDTQASLFYVAPDPTATIDMQLFCYRGFQGQNQHVIDKKKIFVDQRTFALSEGASTLADLLEQLNEAVPSLTHPDVTAADISSPAGADPNLMARCGQWVATASGRFEFTAATTLNGKIKEMRLYHPAAKEYFVNIRMSESMRVVLGVEDADIRVFGRESSLRTYRRLLDQIHAQLPAYRNDIDNWRWQGAANMKTLSDWYQTMSPFLNVHLLNCIFCENTLDQYQQTVQRPDISHAIRPSVDMPQVRTHFSRFRHEWNLLDYFVDNYRSGDPVGTDSQHEKSVFSHFVRERTVQVGGLGAQFTEDQLEFRQVTVPNAVTATTIDHLFDNSLNQAAGDGVGAYKMNGKLSWGTWSRSFILGIPNRRQMYVNSGTLTDLDANEDEINLANGGTKSTPAVGDTLYIPDSTNTDGTGAVVHMRYQRAVIQSVEVTTVVRAAGKAADAAWLLTFDTELESAAARITNLTPILNPGQNDHGVPRQRVIWGTRRVPYQALVYISTTTEIITAVNGEFSFICADEMPVYPGDHVYIGHTLGSSSYAHEVHSVNYVTGQVTIEDGGIAGIADGAVIYGFSQFFDVCHEHDSVAGHLTAATNFVDEPNHGLVRDPVINHADVFTRITGIMGFVANSRIPWDLTATATQGVRFLEASDIASPSLHLTDYQSGNIQIRSDPSGIVRGAGTGNTMVVSDLSAHIGANAFFVVTQAINHAANNQTMYPSHYFNVDATDLTGQYSDLQFRNFVAGHIAEDWMLDFRAIANATVLTGKANLTDNAGNLVANVESNSPHVLIPRVGAHMFRLAGALTLPSRGVLGNLATDPVLKYVVYVHRRSNCPGPVGQLLAQQGQFDFAEGHAASPAVFCAYVLRSGYKDMDAVQIVYKENTTLSIRDNADGLNFSLRTQDRIKSTLSGQVDIAFKFKSVSITSADLLATPERTGDANELQPVLSSYSLETVFEAGVKPNGEVANFTSTPYGTITFSESGPRRYHNLNAIPGSMRQFTIRAVLDPKDGNTAKTRVTLPPAGRFSCQLLFVQKK